MKRQGSLLLSHVERLFSKLKYEDEVIEEEKDGTHTNKKKNTPTNLSQCYTYILIITIIIIARGRYEHEIPLLR